jgi:hypothetical protein
MDVFALQRMRFDGQALVEDPPRQVTTGRTIRDPKDPEFSNPETYHFDLNSEELVVPWES